MQKFDWSLIMMEEKKREHIILPSVINRRVYGIWNNQISKNSEFQVNETHAQRMSVSSDYSKYKRFNLSIKPSIKM